MNSSGPILKRVKHEPSDGRPPIRYTIELMDKSLNGEAAQFWVDNFVPRSNILNAVDERFGKGNSRDVERTARFLSNGITLAAFLEDDQGNRGPLIGVNILTLERNEPSEIQKSKEQDRLEVANLSERNKINMQTVADVVAKADPIYTTYNCSSYICDRILMVAPEYGRRGIAGELLQAVGEVCRMTGISVCAAVFIGEASQKVGASCGFETLSELDLTTYRINGELVYTNVKWPLIKWMAKRYL